MKTITYLTLCFLGVFALLQPAAAASIGYRLDGRSPLYIVPPQRALDLNAEVTLEAWIRADHMGQGLSLIHISGKKTFL